MLAPETFPPILVNGKTLSDLAFFARPIGGHL